MKKLILFVVVFCAIYRSSLAEDKSLTVYAYVNGLVCDFCARALEMTIGKKDAVKAINVNLKEKVITINFKGNQRLEDSVISQLINDAGYTVREITDEKKWYNILDSDHNSIIKFVYIFGNIAMLCVTGFIGYAWYGATLAGLIGVFPYITFISDYKEYIFTISGILIFFGFFSQWSTKSFSCPSDPVKAKLCSKLRSFSWIILYISLTLFLVGFFFAFIAVHIFFE